MPHFAGQRDGPGAANTSHAGCNVDSIPPNIKLVTFLTNNASDYRAKMYAYSRIPFQLPRYSRQFEAALNNGRQRIVLVFKQPRCSHESVTDRLNLLQAMRFRHLFE